MEEKKQYCQNCGHDCHCGGKCQQEVVDGWGEKYKIECCGNCRHEKKEDPSSLFNGA